jgi:hypothetical protein
MDTPSPMESPHEPTTVDDQGKDEDIQRLSTARDAGFPRSGQVHYAHRSMLEPRPFHAGTETVPIAAANKKMATRRGMSGALQIGTEGHRIKNTYIYSARLRLGMKYFMSIFYSNVAKLTVAHYQPCNLGPSCG